MRTAELGTYRGFSKKLFTQDVSLEIFRRICLCRFFELNLKKVYDQKSKEFPVYLSLGQESVAAAFSVAFPEAKALFAQHRAHDWYLCFGDDIEALIDELLGRSTGCAGGMGGSASIHFHSEKFKMFGHDGHMGTQVPISVGYALGSNDKTIAVMGDASAEEGYALGALGEAATKKLPILFVCVDNNLSIKTKVEVRRSWLMANEAKAKGMPSAELTDEPWNIMVHVNQLKKQLPAFMNIHVCRELWHAGTGCDGPPEWNRFELIKSELTQLGLEKEVNQIQNEIKCMVDKAWEKRLEIRPMLSGSSAVIQELPDPHKIPRPTLTPEESKLNVAQTISNITEKHLLENNGVALGQCLTAVGRVAKTVPDLTEEQGLIELSMDDTSGNYIAVGCALAGRRPIFIERYQGFLWFGAAGIANYAAKSKDLWKISCPIFLRAVAMDGGMGPVASNSHHGIFMRMPGISICAPMTPSEYEWAWKYFMANDNPICVSEHRRSFKIDYEMPDKLHPIEADITLFPISSTRIDAIKAAEILAEEGIRCNVIHIVWLKPFKVDARILDPLEDSLYGGLVLDGDYADGAAIPIAYRIMQKTQKKVDVLALDDRSAGFAPHLDNLSPSPNKIVQKIKKIISKDRS